MRTVRLTLRAALSRLWSTDAPLTLTGLAMLPVLTFAVAGLVLDPRLIAGAPAWLKPAKFAASALAYSLTLAWMFGYLGRWPRTRRLVGRTTAGVFILEVGLVCVQAWRGTTSHFNVSAPVDAVVFGVMGVAIGAQTLASGFVLVALWRQPFTDRAMGTALRAGMLITLLGAASAGFMTRPTSPQLADMANGHAAVAGAHTVGGVDGGPGLPGTGWSTAHGDLRVPHFVGLHAMQVLPLVALALRGRRREAASRTIARVAVAYGALFALLLLQALRGEPLLSPGSLMLTLFASWITLSGLALWPAVTARVRGGRTASNTAAAVY